MSTKQKAAAKYRKETERLLKIKNVQLADIDKQIERLNYKREDIIVDINCLKRSDNIISPQS